MSPTNSPSILPISSTHATPPSIPHTSSPSLSSSPPPLPLPFSDSSAPVIIGGESVNNNNKKNNTNSTTTTTTTTTTLSPGSSLLPALNVFEPFPEVLDLNAWEKEVQAYQAEQTLQLDQACQHLGQLFHQCVQSLTLFHVHQWTKLTQEITMEVQEIQQVQVEQEKTRQNLVEFLHSIEHAFQSLTQKRTS